MNQELCFFKYSGAGNDFILIDGRSDKIIVDQLSIPELCSRKTGIGADGLLLIENSDSSKCKMRIFNADGSEAEMCGNGIRCVVEYLYPDPKNDHSCTIESLRKEHLAWKKNNSITIDMGSPTDVLWEFTLGLDDQMIHLSSLNTGVPHAVIFCDHLDQINVADLGPKIRFHPAFGSQGINVNFVQLTKNGIKIRTYERGVESETLACGTGATAAAIVAAKKFNISRPIQVFLQSKDRLTIDFKIEDNHVFEVTMSGPCTKVFEGKIKLNRFSKKPNNLFYDSIQESAKK